MSLEREIIKLLSKVLSGEMTPEMALDSWPCENEAGKTRSRKTPSKLLGNAWHTLYHYSIDDDIRAKDQSYEDRQRRAIREIIEALERAANAKVENPPREE
jgi:hypothetical protein